MQVLDITEIQLEWSDLRNLTYHARQEEVRAEGLHVSDVLKHLAIKSKTYTDEDRDDDMPLRILLGLAFEEAAARLYKDMHWQPGQMHYDGITGSPDGITCLDYDVLVSERFGARDFATIACVDEFKYTGKSQRIKGGKAHELKDIRTEWMWMQQGMSYINLFRRVAPPIEPYKNLTLCRFHICWKYGNYERPFTERYMRYLVEFTEAELRGNWSMLQAFKRESWCGDE